MELTRNRTLDQVNSHLEVLKEGQLAAIWNRARDMHIEGCGTPVGCLHQAICETLGVDDLPDLPQ